LLPNILDLAITVYNFNLVASLTFYVAISVSVVANTDCHVAIVVCGHHVCSSAPLTVRSCDSDTEPLFIGTTISSNQSTNTHKVPHVHLL